MAAKDSRLDAIRAALKDVPLADLRKAAAKLPPELGQALDEVVRAMEGQDTDDEALALALAALPSQDSLVNALGNVAPQVQAQADRLKAGLATMTRQLEHLQAHRDAVREGFAELDALAADDPELLALMRQAAATVSDDEPWTASRMLLDQASLLVESLSSMTDPQATTGLKEQDLTAHGEELERAAHQLEAATRPLLQELPELLDQTAALALSRHHALAPAVAIQAARVWEVRAGMGQPDTVQRWEQAFVTCLQFKTLPGAWVAGKRLQSAALPSGDYERVAVIAHQVADLAYAQGARPQAVLARMEEAQCLARVPEGQDAARTYASDALAVAEQGEDHGLRTQARLMYGQVLELLEDPASAAAHYEAALGEASAVEDWTAVQGRIALCLGRLLAEETPKAAAERLTQALDVGLAHRDRALLSAVLTPAVELALIQDQEQEAAAMVRAVVQSFALDGGEDTVLAHAVERWGSERVREWLAR